MSGDGCHRRTNDFLNSGVMPRTESSDRNARSRAATPARRSSKLSKYSSTELRFAELSAILHHRPQRRLGILQRSSNCKFQILVVPANDRPCVVQRLRYHLSARLGIPEELALAEHHPALRREPKIVEIARR